MLEIQKGNKNPANVHEWTWDTKVQVATGIVVHGNARLVSKETGVPFDTINNWRKTDWWQQLMNEVRKTKREELSGKMNTAVDKALEIVQDRLEYGDFVLNNKTGEIVRKPVALKDANKVLTEVINTQIRMEQEEEVVMRQESTSEILKNLAAEFSKFNRQVAKQTVIDVNFKEVVDNALHEERKTGLQDGSSEVHQST